MPRFALLPFLLTGVLAPGLPAAFQDKKEARPEVAAQKAAAAANLKKAELGKTALVETDNFLIGTTVSEEKAKALGAVLEKVVPVARKGLQFDEKEEPWKGKLAVYVLPDNRDFKSFMRGVVVAPPEGVHYSLRSDEPLVVDPVDVPAKASEAEQFANTAAVVATAYLKGKAGTASVPDWLAEGFGRLTAMRAEGLNSKRYSAYKTAARGLPAKGLKASDLWAETRPTGADVLAASVAEILAYGTMAREFPKVLSAFRPDDNGNTPGVEQAIQAGGWKDAAALDSAWKKWVTAVK
jgi:hypothetical protein